MSPQNETHVTCPPGVVIPSDAGEATRGEVRGTGEATTRPELSERVCADMDRSFVTVRGEQSRSGCDLLLDLESSNVT
jgi:hypothetical protein